MSAIDMIDEWLDDEKHATLWGRSFDIVDVDSRRNAAEWFKKQVESFYSFNSGCAVQLRNDDPDVEGEVTLLRNEIEQKDAEIEDLRKQVKQLRTAALDRMSKTAQAAERMPFRVDL